MAISVSQYAWLLPLVFLLEEFAKSLYDLPKTQVVLKNLEELKYRKIKKKGW